MPPGDILDILDFKERFNVKARKDCARRELKTVTAINDLESAVKGLTKATAHGATANNPTPEDIAAAAKVQELQQKLAQMRTDFQQQQQNAALRPYQSYQQLDALKKDARKAAGSAMREAAPKLMARLKKENDDRLLLDDEFNVLAGSYAAVETCVKDGKSASEIALAQRTFFDESEKVLAERDRRKAAWDPLSKPIFDRMNQMDNLATMAKLVGLDAVAKAAAAAKVSCEDARLKGLKGDFATAKSDGEKALAEVAAAQAPWDQRLAGGNVKGLLAPAKKQAEELLKAGTKSKRRWLAAEAQTVLALFDGAIQKDVPASHPEAMTAAVASLAEMGKLTIKWNDYQRDIKEWHEHDPKRNQRKSLAKLFISAAAERKKTDPGEDFKWLEDGAKAYLAEIAEAEKLYKQGFPKEAYNKANNKGYAFNYDVVVRYNKIQGKELLAQADLLIAADPDGPEAQMKNALAPEVFTERLAEVTNAAKAAGARHNLSLGEMVAIYTYTAADYDDMNQLLIFGTCKEKDRKRLETSIKVAKAALAKLKPPYTQSNTRRGEKPWPGSEQTYVQGQTFTTKQFWSTGVGFNFKGLYQFTIVPKKGKTPAGPSGGKQVAAFSQFVHEAEVLFPPGTTFFVKTRTGDEQSGCIKLTVEEH